MPHKLQLMIQGKGAIVCVEVEGQLAAATAHQIPKEIDVAIAKRTQSVQAVILNCRKLDYVSGIGWHSILTLGQSLHDRDIKLMLVDLQPQLRVIFKNRDYLGLLSIHRTIAEAHKALS